MDQQPSNRPRTGDGQCGIDLPGRVLPGQDVGDWSPPAPDGPCVHRPRRPDWSCETCEQVWPCQAGKLELMAQYADDRVGLLVYLAGLLVDAVQEVDAPPNLLLDRFLRWAKIGGTPQGPVE